MSIRYLYKAYSGTFTASINGAWNWANSWPERSCQNWKAPHLQKLMTVPPMALSQLIKKCENNYICSMKTLNAMYLGVLVCLAGKFFRFIDLHSAPIECTSNILRSEEQTSEIQS